MMRSAIAVVLLAAGYGVCWASPTGLNNIPTTDVVPQDVLVLQTWGLWGPGAPAAHTVGLKYGPAAGLEIGADWQATGAGSPGPLAFQAKYRVLDTPEGWGLTLGAANLAAGSAAMPYVVASKALGDCHLYLGYSGQNSNEGLFWGADLAATDRLTLRADWVQTHARQESLSSLGFLYGLSDQWAVEGWTSFPTDSAATYLLKLDYVLDFASGA